MIPRRLLKIWEAIGQRVGSLTRVMAPTQEVLGSKLPKDVTSAYAVFGPFRDGDLVRVQASGNCWFAFVEQGTDLSGFASDQGIPLAGWDRQDFEVVSEGRRSWLCAIIADDSATECDAIAWKTGNVSDSFIRDEGDAFNVQ